MPDECADATLLPNEPYVPSRFGIRSAADGDAGCLRRRWRGHGGQPWRARVDPAPRFLTADGSMRLYGGGPYSDSGALQVSRPAASQQFVGTFKESADHGGATVTGVVIEPVRRRACCTTTAAEAGGGVIAGLSVAGAPATDWRSSAIDL